MKIWLDLANSPQVLVFRPIVEMLQRYGHAVEITTRAYAQTVELADRAGLAHTVVGRHGGRSISRLATSNAERVVALARWARKRQFDLAVSHNSYSQAVAARLIGVPSVTMMDYEHQPLNHICFRLANRVIVPEAFPERLLRRFGAARKSWRYPGVKEQIYLADFKPATDFREREGLPSDVPLAVIRPPAPWTAYHRFENSLFDVLVDYLVALGSPYLLFIPRTAEQAAAASHVKRLHIARGVYDGPDLLYHADAVISGGGTMNREAAVLGTRTYTIFAGRLAAVDEYLIAAGRMTHLRTESDFAKIAILRENKKPDLGMNGGALLDQIVNEILATVRVSERVLGASTEERQS